MPVHYNSILYTMKLFKSLIMLVAFAIMPLCALAQQQAAVGNTVIVNGNVCDTSGHPLEGVAVMIVGNQLVGTVTNSSGDFALEVKLGTEIVASSIGYADTRVTVSGPSVSIVMEEDSQYLDEVVVVGYGTARKGDLTSQISNVDGSNLVERGSAQVSTALQGQVSGVQITRDGGDPSSTGSIRIHGMTTLSENDPLVIIDGVPGNLDYIDASDIETISILKDASAAAIYGSRAAAGVILVTTKRAKTDQFILNYNYEFSVDTPTTIAENANVVDWLNVFNEITLNDGASAAPYAQEYIDSYMANRAKDPIHYPDTDWHDLILKNHTTHQKHSMSVSGGTDKIKTVATFNYYNGNGYYNNKSFDKISGRLNSDLNITKWMKASIDLQYHYTTNNDIPVGTDIIRKAQDLPPIYTAFWGDGSYADVKDGGNLVPLVEDGGFMQNKHYGFQGKAQLDITPTKGLTLSAIVSPNFNFSRDKKFEKGIVLYYEDGKSLKSTEQPATNLYENRGFSESYTYQALANYQNKFGAHSLNAMAGYEGYTYFHELLSASRKNYILTNFPYLSQGPKDYQYNDGSASHNAYQSVFGRVIYSFKDKYLIQASVRADGSSRFDSKYRWGVFPSISLGWVISDEPWFNNSTWANYLKAKISVGQLGNERLGSDFPYQALMNFGTSYLYNNSNKSVEAVQSAFQKDYAYEDLTWETTTTYGAGLEGSFFGNRLTASVDGYYKKTSNMLLAVGFPAYYGYTAPQANAGDMYTYGYDIEIGWKDRVGDFTYSISANLSDYRSKMGYLGDKRTLDGNYLYEKGSYFREWYMYKTDGLIQTEADLFDAQGNPIPSLTSVNKAGFIKYVDVTGDGNVNADDKVCLGNSNPEYLYGGNISLGYKNFDFSLQFQGIGHQLVLIPSKWIQPIRDGFRAVPQILMGNFWSENNTPEQNLNAKYPRLTSTYQDASYAASDFWLFNGAYFRVKNINIGYNFPKNITDSVRLKGLRLYANIADLPAISNYPKGYDPEWSYGSAYISTSFSLGLNVKF